jgi:hypothetical protein
VPNGFAAAAAAMALRYLASDHEGDSLRGNCRHKQVAIESASVLFNKPLSEIDVADIRALCRRHREGIRVEYKAALTDDVRRKLPAIVSSLANSYGGIICIGVNTDRGNPLEPIEGYKTNREEPVVTIQNICRDGIDPPLMPTAREIQSDIPGRAFLVIAVEESRDAPHAIENSRKVYVRTGDSNTPLDLASVSQMERLLDRRRLASRRWDQFRDDANALIRRYSTLRDWPMLITRIGPQFPGASLTDRDSLLSFLKTLQGPWVTGAAFRHPAGAGVIDRFKEPSIEFLVLSTTGQLIAFNGQLHFSAPELACEIGAATHELFSFAGVTKNLKAALQLSMAVLTHFGYFGTVIFESDLINVAGRGFVGETFRLRRYFESIADTVTASTHFSMETAKSQEEILTELLFELMWPFVGQHENFSREDVLKISKST